MCMCAYEHVCIFACIYICVCGFLNICIILYVRLSMCTYVLCLCVLMCVCDMCLCLCVYVHVHEESVYFYQSMLMNMLLCPPHNDLCRCLGGLGRAHTVRSRTLRFLIKDLAYAMINPFYVTTTTI